MTILVSNIYSPLFFLCYKKPYIENHFTYQIPHLHTLGAILLHQKTVLMIDPLNSLGQVIFWGICWSILGGLTHLASWHKESENLDTSFPLTECVDGNCIVITRSLDAPRPLAPSVSFAKRGKIECLRTF